MKKFMWGLMAFLSMFAFASFSYAEDDDVVEEDDVAEEAEAPSDELPLAVYGGVGIGQQKFDVSARSTGEIDDGTYYSMTIGMEYSRHFAVEYSYTAPLEDTNEINGVNGTNQGDYEYIAHGLWPVVFSTSGTMYFKAKLGAVYISDTITNTPAAGLVEPSNSDWQPGAGIGVGARNEKSYAELMYTSVGDTDPYDSLSINVGFRF
jgi:hypothetical protein